MFERPKGGERTVLVQINTERFHDEAVMAEFRLLAESAGAEIISAQVFNRGDIEPRYFIGKGQAEALAEIVRAEAIELVIFNVRLSPSQERNLEKLLQARVLDRSGLVLDIFAQRARSHEGKLQVELAQLNHLSTRLVRGWTHLERQKGGIGLRGPGETQLETDRRLLGERIKQLQARLKKVSQQRAEIRKSREALPTVALAGYTNSGKSTLFNRLTRSDVLAKDQLFATLDPTWRKLHHSEPDTILLADTVGFVQDLPHELVEAFHSTLEETIFADLILQVIDVADPEHLEREAVVNEVLKEIEADQIPMIKVYNKIDQTPYSPSVLKDETGRVQTVFLSALTGDGVEALISAITAFFRQDEREGWLWCASNEHGLRGQLYRERAVLSEHYLDNGSSWLHLKISEKRLKQLQAEYNRPFQLTIQPNE